MTAPAHPEQPKESAPTATAPTRVLGGEKSPQLNQPERQGANPSQPSATRAILEAARKSPVYAEESARLEAEYQAEQPSAALAEERELLAKLIQYHGLDGLAEYPNPYKNAQIIIEALRAQPPVACQSGSVCISLGQCETVGYCLAAPVAPRVEQPQDTALLREVLTRFEELQRELPEDHSWWTAVDRRTQKTMARLRARLSGETKA